MSNLNPASALRLSFAAALMANQASTPSDSGALVALGGGAGRIGAMAVNDSTSPMNRAVSLDGSDESAGRRFDAPAAASTSTRSRRGDPHAQLAAMPNRPTRQAHPASPTPMSESDADEHHEAELSHASESAHSSGNDSDAGRGAKRQRAAVDPPSSGVDSDAGQEEHSQTAIVAQRDVAAGIDENEDGDEVQDPAYIVAQKKHEYDDLVGKATAMVLQLQRVRHSSSHKTAKSKFNAYRSLRNKIVAYAKEHKLPHYGFLKPNAFTIETADAEYAAMTTVNLGGPVVNYSPPAEMVDEMQRSSSPVIVEVASTSAATATESRGKVVAQRAVVAQATSALATPSSPTSPRTKASRRANAKGRVSPIIVVNDIERSEVEEAPLANPGETPTSESVADGKTTRHSGPDNMAPLSHRDAKAVCKEMEADTDTTTPSLRRLNVYLPERIKGESVAKWAIRRTRRRADYAGQIEKDVKNHAEVLKQQDDMLLTEDGKRGTGRYPEMQQLVDAAVNLYEKHTRQLAAATVEQDDWIYELRQLWPTGQDYQTIGTLPVSALTIQRAPRIGRRKHLGDTPTLEEQASEWGVSESEVEYEPFQLAPTASQAATASRSASVSIKPAAAAASSASTSTRRAATTENSPLVNSPTMTDVDVTGDDPIYGGVPQHPIYGMRLIPEYITYDAATNVHADIDAQISAMDFTKLDATQIAATISAVLIREVGLLPANAQRSYRRCRNRLHTALADEWCERFPQTHMIFNARERYLGAADANDEGDETHRSLYALATSQVQVSKLTRMGAVYKHPTSKNPNAVHQLEGRQDLYSISTTQQCDEYDFLPKSEALCNNEYELMKMGKIHEVVAQNVYRAWWAQRGVKKASQYAQDDDVAAMENIQDIADAQFERAAALHTEFCESSDTWERPVDTKAIGETCNAALAPTTKPAARVAFRSLDAASGSSSSSSSAKPRLPALTALKSLLKVKTAVNKPPGDASLNARNKLYAGERMSKAREELAAAELSRTAGPRGSTPFATSISMNPIAKLGYEATIVIRFPDFYRDTPEGQLAMTRYEEEVAAGDKGDASDSDLDVPTEADTRFTTAHDGDASNSDDDGNTSMSSSTSAIGKRSDKNALKTLKQRFSYVMQNGNLPDDLRASLMNEMPAASSKGKSIMYASSRHTTELRLGGTAPSTKSASRSSQNKRGRQVIRSANFTGIARVNGQPSHRVMQRYGHTAAFEAGRAAALADIGAYDVADAKCARVKVIEAALRKEQRAEYRSELAAIKAEDARSAPTSSNIMMIRRVNMMAADSGSPTGSVSSSDVDDDEAALTTSDAPTTARIKLDTLKARLLAKAAAATSTGSPTPTTPTIEYDSRGHVIDSSAPATATTTVTAPVGAAPASSSRRNNTGIKLADYDKNGTISPADYITQFMSFCSISGVSSTQMPALLAYHNRDPPVQSAMQRVLAKPGRSALEQLNAVLEIFYTTYQPNELTQTNNQFRLRLMKKGPDESVSDYLDRFIQAWHLAHPGNHSIADQIKESLHGLEESMQLTYTRQIAMGGMLNGKAVGKPTWQGYKSTLKTLYATQTPAESLQSIREHHHRRAESSTPFTNKYRLDMDADIDAQASPFVNPAASSRTQRLIRQIMHDDGTSSADDDTRHSSKHQRTTTSTRGRATTRRRANALRHSYSNSDDSDSNADMAPQEDHQRPAAATTRRIRQVSTKADREQQRHVKGENTNGGYGTARPNNNHSQQGSGANSTPLGYRDRVDKPSADAMRETKNWDSRKQCAGDAHACGHHGHRWENCERNPRSSNHVPRLADKKGPHPALGTTAEKFVYVVRVNRHGSDSNHRRINMHVTGRVGDYDLPLMLADSGAESSLMDIATWKAMSLRDIKLTPTVHKFIAANGQPIKSFGDVTLPLTLFDKAKRRAVTKVATFTVMENLNCPVLLGFDTLSDFFESLNFRSHECKFRHDVKFDGENHPVGMDPLTESMLVVHKGTSVKAGGVTIVSVRFESHLITLRGKATIVLCEPIPIYDRHRHRINISFPPHITDGERPKVGQYQLAIANPSNIDVQLRAGQPVGTARVVPVHQVYSSLSEVKTILAAVDEEATRLVANVTVERGSTTGSQ